MFCASISFLGYDFNTVELALRDGVPYAIDFCIFDLEIAFLFPWAVVLDSIGTFGLISMGIFLFILVIGFIYEWKKGALEWD